MAKHVILFLAANPSGTSELKLGEECSEIRRQLRMADHRDDFAIESRWAVSVDDLLGSLNELQPSVIHFSGHGEHDTGLVLQNEHGDPQLVSPAALERIVAAAAGNVRLIVLNACYANEQAVALQQTAECVVGMAGSVADDHARAYAAGFYRALGYRKSIGVAHQQGIATVLGRSSPVLFPRDLRKQPLDRQPATDVEAFKPVLLVRDGQNPNKLWLTPPARGASLLPLTVLPLAVVLAVIWPRGSPVTPVDAKAPEHHDARPVVLKDAPADTTRDAAPDAPRDAAPDAPRDAAPDAPPKLPVIRIIEPRDGSYVTSAFKIVAQAEGDDLLAVDLQIDGSRRQSIAAPGPYIFRASSLNNDRPRVQVTARNKHGRFADASIAVSVLYPICSVPSNNVHNPPRRTARPPPPESDCTLVDGEGKSSRPDDPTVPRSNNPKFNFCEQVYECRRWQ